MKKCSYCGAEYPDDLVVCPIDQTPFDQQEQAIAPTLPEPTKRRSRIVLVVRDIIIFWILTMGGCLIAGFVIPRSTPEEATTKIVGIITSLGAIVAFTIVGSLVPSGRWYHLFLVAVGVWLTTLALIPLYDYTVWRWFGGSFWLAVNMGIGGGISYVFKKTPKPPPNTARGCVKSFGQ